MKTPTSQYERNMLELILNLQKMERSEKRHQFIQRHWINIFTVLLSLGGILASLYG